jgi:branched-chain amino acid transport system permease protein
MTQFLQTLLNSLSVAAVYALIAMGFVIIYKSMQVLSFAQPGLMILGGYWVIYFATIQGWNWYLSIGIGIIAAAATGVLIERAFLRPMVGKPVFAVSIMTIGIDLAIRIVSGNLYGIGKQPPTGDSFGFSVFRFGDLFLSHRRAAAIVVAVILVTALLAFFRYTRIGLAMRATAFDQEVALTQGVSVSTVFALSWAFAAVLAAMAGLFISPDTGTLSPEMFPLALKALPVVVIGGLDSIGGALIAAVVVAVAEQLTTTYQPQYATFLGSQFSTVVPYLVMVIVLLVRPYGFFGTREVERV